MARSYAPGRTRERILDAARHLVVTAGISRLSTRSIADEAGVPLSQLHYHFGGKKQLVLALLERQNQRLLRRQQALYADALPLWQQWEQACDFLEDDLRSGYVQVLHEMIAAGWSDDAVAERVRDGLRGWFELLAEVAGRAAERLDGLGPFTPEEVAALVGDAFVGAEALILLGFAEAQLPSRAALRKVGVLIRTAEQVPATGG